MNLNFLIGSLLTGVGEHLTHFGTAINPTDAKTPITPSPDRHVLPIPATGDNLVGPWKNVSVVPVLHGGVPLVPPDPSRFSPAKLEDQVTALVLAHNHALPYIDGVVFDLRQGTPLDTGSRIHEIDGPTARAIAQTIVQATAAKQFDLPFALAQIAIESAFDPKAEMGNFRGSNTDHLLERYDMGLCQLKLLYVIGHKNSKGDVLTDAPAARDFAFDMHEAIPFFVQKLAGLLAWADAKIPTLSPTVNPKFRNRYYLAAGAYNFGETDLFAKIADGSDLAHCVHVSHLCANFAKVLRLPNVLAVPIFTAPPVSVSAAAASAVRAAS